MSNFVKGLQRFSLPLQLCDDAWPPTPGQMSQLHFQKSNVPGHVQVFIGGQWYEVAAALLMHGVITICPIEGPLPPIPTPTNPLRRV